MAQLSLFDLLEIVSVPRKRSEVRPLDQAEAIFAILSQLPVGAEVPQYILINDYEDMEIPVWIVQEREQGEVLQVLTLVDKATLHQNILGITEGLACEVFTAPGKTLMAPIYAWTPGGPKRRDKLADIRQHARQWNERNVADE